MKRAGNLTLPWTRATVTSPVSIGCRIVSSTGLGNSGSSSRNRMPWWASDTSPGRGIEPPPMRAWAVAEWCGVRTGRRSSNATPSGSNPMAE